MRSSRSFGESKHQFTRQMNIKMIFLKLNANNNGLTTGVFKVETVNSQNSGYIDYNSKSNFKNEISKNAGVYSVQ